MDDKIIKNISNKIDLIVWSGAGVGVGRVLTSLAPTSTPLIKNWVFTALASSLNQITFSPLDLGRGQQGSNFFSSLTPASNKWDKYDKIQKIMLIPYKWDDLAKI